MLFVIVAGAVGGLANAVISGPMQNPHKVEIDGKVIGYRLGTLGNIFIGSVASFTFWALGITSNVEPQVYGIAVLSGMGGARFLTSLLDNQVARFERDKLTDALAETIKEDKKTK